MKSQFLDLIKETIRVGYESKKKDGWDKKSFEDALIWTSCWFEAEEMLDVHSTKDWAELLLNGRGATDTVEKALEYFESTYDGCGDDPEDIKTATKAMVLKTRIFWNLSEETGVNTR